MKTNRFNEVMDKLNGMFKKSNEIEKDNLVKDLKNWLKNNRKSEDKEKVDAINCFLANNGIY